MRAKRWQPAAGLCRQSQELIRDPQHQLDAVRHEQLAMQPLDVRVNGVRGNAEALSAPLLALLTVLVSN